MYEILLDSPSATIYSQAHPDNYKVLGPKCSLEINEAGGLQFTLLPGHPLINTLEPIASFIRANDDGEEIFYGRVLQRSDPTLTGQVSFQCEGALCFLLDSEVTPFGKDQDGNQIEHEWTAEQFFRWCIAEHNACLQDSRRAFTVGVVTASQRNETATYSISSYTQTKGALESNLLNVYGGFLRVRKSGNDHLIDWIDNYDRVDPQPVQIGVNLEEQTNEKDGSSLFTVIRPVGKDGITLTEGTLDLYSQADMAKYGRIVKTIDFPSAETESELRSMAQAYQGRIEATLFASSNVRLVDMHYLDGTKPKIRLGDRFTNLPGLEGSTMVAATMEIDFEAPQNDTVGFKNRKSLDPDLTPEGHGHGSRGLNGTKSASTISGSTARSKSSSGQYFKTLIEHDKNLKIQADLLEIEATQIDTHAQTLRTTGDAIEQLSRRAGAAEDTLAKIDRVWDNVTYSVERINGTGIVQNAETIADVAGQFEIWTDDQNHKIVHLKNGAEIAVDDDTGGTITVGERIAQLDATITGVGAFVDTMQGSALWTQRDNITAVCGEYDVQTERVPDGNGGYSVRKTLVIKSGGGMRIRKDGVEHGVYMTNDTGDTVLTGGVMVEQINGSTGTKIFGSRVDIEASDVQIRANQTLDSVVGHFEEETYTTTDENGDTVTRKRLVYKADGGMRVQRLDDNGNLVTVGLYDDNNLTAGLIARMINTSSGQTEARIKANRIVLDADGTVKLSDVMDVSDSGINIRERMYAQQIYIQGGNSLVFLGTGTPAPRYELTPLKASTMIVSASVRNNTLTLTPMSGNAITFSKATTLSDPAWSGSALVGRIMTINAVQENDDGNGNAVSTNVNNRAYKFADGTKLAAAQDNYNSSLGGSWDQTTNIYTGKIGYYVTTVSGTDVYADTGLRYEVDATNIRTLGKMDVTLNEPLWEYNGDNVSTNHRNANTVSVSTNGRPTQSAKSASINMTQDANWVSNKKWVYTRNGTSATGAYVAMLEVDASSVRTAGKNDVGISDLAWTYSGDDVSANNYSSNTIGNSTTGRPTDIPKSASINMTQDANWVSHKKKVYVRQGTSATGAYVAQLEVNATTEYNNGWHDAYGDITWEASNGQTISPGSSTVISIKCKQYPDSNAKTAKWSVTVTANSASHSPSVSDHYLEQYNSDGPGTIVKSIAKASCGGSTSSAHTIYVYLQQDGENVYAKKDGWSGTNVGRCPINGYHPNWGPKLYHVGKRQLYYESQGYKTVGDANTDWYYVSNTDSRQYYY